MFQQVEEWAWWLALIRSHQCRSILEVGCNVGETTATMALQCPPGSVVRGIDSADDPGKILKRLSSRYDCGVARGYSDAPDIIEWARRRAPYDAVFIDADHSYEAVKADWDNYGPMARKLVGFHDVGPYSSCTGVRKLWTDLKRQYRSAEKVCDYIHPVHGEQQGIGVLFVGGN